MGELSVVTEEFGSGGERCAATLYRPAMSRRPPVVVMAHGFAAERSFVLPRVAERFANAELAVFLFDYRGFGDSEGRPRHLVSPRRHLADWEAAVAHVREHPDVDGSRIGLWGTSLSGGHVISLAARDHGIAAIVAQCPLVDPLTSMRWIGYRHAWRWLLGGLRDKLHQWLGREPFTVPVFGPPASGAMLPTAEARRGYPLMIPANSTWENKCPARSMLALPFYRPRGSAKRIRCPALIFVAADDSLVYESSVLKTAAQIPRSELVAVAGGHFGIYHGRQFESAVGRQIEFLNTALCAAQ